LAEPCGTLIAFGVNDAAKSVEVVAIDSSARLRKRVYELGIRMIHDVKDIVVTAKTQGSEWVCREATRDTIYV
jgi:hypothetical protein